MGYLGWTLTGIAAIALFLYWIWPKQLVWGPGSAWGLSPGAWFPCDKRVGQAGYPAAKSYRAVKPLPGFKEHRQAPSNRAKLESTGMPVLETTDDVLAWLKLELRSFLALADPTDRVRPGKSNYIEWAVPKKLHYMRVICSPKPRLKAVQLKIKEEILDLAPLHDAAHGFVRGRNIVTNAAPHVGKPLIVNLDLRDFFDYVRYPRVIGVFRWLGYSLEVSRCLALLCTYRPNLGPLDHDTMPRFVRRAFRHAVQGAPTSPALANLAVNRLDRRLEGLARRFHATYTRYADDLTFSGEEPLKRGMIRFLPLAQTIIREEGFKLNMRKMRFMRGGQRQQVTGVVVNQKPNARREDYERLKAIIHNARKAGSLVSQNREGRDNFRAYLIGRAAHIRQLNRERGQRLLDELRGLS